jgi:LysM domain-containing protein
MSERQRVHSSTMTVTRPPRPSDVPYLRLVSSSGVEPFIPTQRRPVDAPRPAPASRDHDGHRPVRLTRRGRTVLWLLLLGCAIVAMALLAPASQAAAPSGPPRAITVHSGDTMWSIASAMLPQDAPNVAAERIRVLNHLPDDEVYVGEQLLIPAA